MNGNCPLLLFLTREQELLELPLRNSTPSHLSVLEALGSTLKGGHKTPLSLVMQKSWGIAAVNGSAVGCRCRARPKLFWQAVTYGDMRNTSSHVQRLSQGPSAEAKGKLLLPAQL